MTNKTRTSASIQWVLVTVFIVTLLPVLRASAASEKTDWAKAFEKAKRESPGFAVESVEEFRKLTDLYASTLSDGVTVGKFELPSGDQIRCIEISSQRSIAASGQPLQLAPGSLPAETATPKKSGPSINLPGAEFGLDGTIDAAGNTRACPAGSFPKLMPHLENLYHFRRLEDFLQKGPNGRGGPWDDPNAPVGQARSSSIVRNSQPAATCQGSSSGHEYAHAWRQVNNTGMSAEFNLWSPTLESSGEMSLSQLWVTGGQTTDCSLQTLETGWQVLPQKYADSRSHLFIFFTTGAYQPGTYCYNRDNPCDRFVQIDNSVIIGKGFDSYSTQGGPQYGISLAFVRDFSPPHNWWLKYGNTLVGYYPNSLFDAEGLADYSDRIDIGGEIVNTWTGGLHTTTDMGSGRFPSEGFGAAAFTRRIQYWDTSSTQLDATLLNRSVTNAYYYDLTLGSNPSDSSWLEYIYFGGPGRTNTPTVITGSASLVNQTSSTVTGTVNPNGNATTAWFMWGPTIAYGNATPAQSVGAGSGPVPISATLSGLSCNTTYHFQAAGNNADGTSPGGDMSFKTAACSQSNYTIAVSASPSSYGTASGSGTYVAGSSCTVTASANSGYSFVNWTESGSVVSSSASYPFTVNGSRTLVANFRSGVVAGTCANPIVISSLSFPYSDSNTTVGKGSSMNWYSCASTKNEGGPEVVYRFTVSTAGDLTVTVPDPTGPPDIDPHLLSSCDPNYCLARDNTSFTYYGLQPGPYYIVCDTYIDASNAGAYTLNVSFSPTSTCTYSLCSSTASVGSGASSGSCAVTTTSGCAWAATSNATSWLTTSSRGSGSGTVTYSYTANSGSSRTGTITVQDKTLTVTQAGGGSCSYSLDPSTANVPAEAGSGSSGVAAPSGCGWTASSNATSWLTTSSNGSGNGTVVFYFTANTGASRTGTITVQGQTLTITQAGASCTYSLSTPTMDVGSGSGSGSSLVYAPNGCAWAAGSNATSWLTTSSSGSGNGTLNFNFTANTGAARVGTITVQGHTLTVTQATGSCTYSTCSGVNVGAGSGSGGCAVNAPSGCAWTASSNATSWLTTSSSGNGNGTVSFDFPANTGASRTGIITVQDQTITVIQGTTCVYSLCSSTTSVGAAAGSSACSVTTTSNCAWTAISDSPTWLTATGSGNGSGTFSYSYTANTGASRTGTITVQEQALMVTQAGISGCEFTPQGPKLVGTEAVGNAGQGWSVSLSSDGNTAIVGGYGDNSNLGAAWIWTRSGGVWAPQGPKLVGAGAVGNAQQGYSVALSANDGNTAIVGGPYDNSGIGAAWVWTRSGGVWIPEAELVGTGVVSHSRQGWSVALSADGNTAIVGGYLDNSGIGAAWVWTRSGGVWTQQGSKLVAADAVGNALQGYSVSLSADGNTAIVGAPYDNRDASGYGPGAAWIWTRSGGVWTKQTKLFGSGAVGYAKQGDSVALSGDGNTALVGGSADNNYAGAAWAWTRSGGVWTPQGAKLIGSGAINSAYGPQQGYSVSLSNDGSKALVGGTRDNGDIGAAWVFARTGGVWTTQTKLVGSGAMGTAVYQGNSVSISSDGKTAIVGGYNDNNWAGAAWVFACVECSLGCTATVPATGSVGVTVSFQSTATPSNCTGSPTYSWAFGDGQTSTQQNPGHTYASAATYNWSMTATVQGATCTKSGSIIISPACSLACTATAPGTGTAGVPVIFQATATPSNCAGSPTYAWTFGDGQTSTQQDPTHTYASAATYNWSMTATVQGVMCTKTGSIVVSAACSLTCTATVPASGTAGTPVSFQAAATPSNCTGSSTYAWDFGDGQISAQQNPSHTYASAATYNWSMTATVQGVPCYKSGTINTYVAAPTITNINPVSGPATGEQSVTITGTNLVGATVTIGGSSATVTGTTATTATFTTPAHAAGVVDVTVTTAGGNATSTGGYTYVAAPTITNINPTNGPTAGGQSVTITGTNLSGTTVAIGGSSATVIGTTATTATFTTPAHAAGAVDVTVTTTGGSATWAGGYTYVAAPTITNINPANGPTAGGQSVTITGTNLSGTTVAIGGSSATVIGTTATTATFTTPAHAAGAVDVTVTTTGGSATWAGGYTYVAAPTITNINPASGPAAGGQSVTITGTNLVGAAVTIGGNAATNSGTTATTATFTTPAHASGAVDVTVTTAGGSATWAGGYTYVAAPTITTINPARGPATGGQSVTITGTDLNGATVTIGGNDATISGTSATTATFTIPAHAAGAVDVTVTTAGGSATWAGGYTYVAAPTITSINPTSGPSAGGQSVTITGTNLSGATVTIGGNSATVTGTTATTATFTTPAHAAGAVSVTVTTAGGPATSTGGYTYVAAPTIASLDPTSGPSAGGQSVTITGTNLSGATVTIGSDSAAVTGTIATTATFTTPAHAAGAVNVTVTTAGGSATSTGGYTYVAAPTIASINPTSGPSAGGQSVTITGTNLSGAQWVTFGGSAGTITANSVTSITATAPAHAEGPVDVVVTTSFGSGTLLNGFTYLPAQRVAANPPTTEVAPLVSFSFDVSYDCADPTLVGLGFRMYFDSTRVTWQGASNVLATGLVVSSGPSLDASDDDGDPQTDSYLEYHWLDLNGNWPGMSLPTRLYSANFRATASLGVTTIRFGHSATTPGYAFSSSSEEILTTDQPSPAPSITAIAPTSGTTAGGTAVTISGTNFAPGATVTIGGTAATFVTVVSSTRITATTPAHSAGAVSVIVTNTDAQSATLASGYAYVAATLSGDVNGDGLVTAADVFYLINTLFAGGPPPIGPSDVNGDSATTAADVFYLINFLFAGGPAPH